jgi:hypothetical protein
MISVTLPPRFYDDHVGRGYPPGREIARNRKGVRVQMTDEDIEALRADAQFYVDMGVAEFGRENLGLIRSAAGVIDRINGALYPDESRDS